MEEEAGAVKGKERRVTFRMEGGDYDALCERCERAGLSKSEYLRYLVRIGADSLVEGPPCRS